MIFSCIIGALAFCVTISVPQKYILPTFISFFLQIQVNQKRKFQGDDVSRPGTVAIAEDGDNFSLASILHLPSSILILRSSNPSGTLSHSPFLYFFPFSLLLSCNFAFLPFRHC